jgi:hypothetical protein
MKHNEKFHVLIFLIFLILIGTSFAPVSLSKNLSSMDEREGRTINGQVLFAPYYSTTTYLIDNTGAINHTWSSAYQPFTSAYWLGNGTILRPISLSNGGGVQKILWDGTLAWDYRYTAPGCWCHHDIRYLPNGNVLMIVWVTKTRTQAIAAGRNPNHLGNSFYPDKIIEVNQTGPTSGNVVWEWNVWDHLIQDYDPSKANYGVVGDHPELIDINFGDTFDFDWLHTNSLDYNSTFDQILIDVHDFDEVWIIDHNTTTEEAAGHTGGHYGHGGDLLYRWGNPQAYRRGTSSDQKLFGQHDATWIKPGYPGEGHILVFNNGYNRPGAKYSSVDEFAPPVNSTGEYYLEPGSTYGPEDFSWDYTANPPTSFYSNVFGSAERLKDNDTLICSGIPGKFFEVTPDGTTVWQYTNPYGSPNKWVFKIDYVPPAESQQQPPIFGTPTPTNGSTNNPLSLTWSIPISDPNGDLFTWTIQCSNGQTNSGTGATNGNKTLALSGLAYSTEYKVWVNATDPDGSGQYTRRWYTFTTNVNQPPNPPTITGPVKAKIKIATAYNFTTTDPNNDNVYYFIDWGDHTNSSWIGPYPTGNEITQSHTWSTKGSYTIKAKAKDIYGNESDWGTLKISMPTSFNIPSLSFLERLFERFPHAFPILRQLLGY